eukprot:13078603-Alexandrium_andersonii.AAC.1
MAQKNGSRFQKVNAGDSEWQTPRPRRGKRSLAWLAGRHAPSMVASFRAGSSPRSSFLPGGASSNVAG